MRYTILILFALALSCREEECKPKPSNCFTMIKISDALPVQFYLNGQPSFNEKIEQGIEHHCFFQPFNEDDVINTQVYGEDSYRLEVMDDNDIRIALLDFDRTGNAHGKSFKPEDLGINNQMIRLNILKAILDTAWTVRSSAADNNWRAIAYGNGIFVAVSTTGSGNRVMTSPDGITWTIQSTPQNNSWRSVAFGAGLFVAVSSGGTNRVMTSPDGVTWTLRTQSVSAFFTSVCYGNGQFVAVSSSTDGMTSPDGINWTTRTLQNKIWQSVVYGDGLYVAVGGSVDANQVQTSPDGITWTLRATPIVAGTTLTKVEFGAGIFVAIDGGGTVVTSDDGITWASNTALAAFDDAVIGYGGGKFIALNGLPVSVTNGVAISSDGINWTFSDLPDTNAKLAVAYGEETFVAVGGAGTGDRVITLGNTYTLEAYTDLLDIQTSHKHTNLLQYSNETDFAGLIYEGITPTPSFGIRVTSKFFKRRNPQEDESESLSDGSVVKLLGTAKKQRLLQVEPAPPYMHDKLTLILQHNTIYLDNRAWIKEESYELEELDEYSAMSLGKAWLTQASDNYVTNPFS